MKYYISDLHFDHYNIIKFCDRPFVTCQEMYETIKERWNNTVQPTDEVYILGDVAFNNDPYKVVDMLRQLNGKKYLIKGNHDKIMLDQRVMKEFESIKLYDEIWDEERRVVLFHFPIEDWNGRFRGSYHLFGHIHNNWDSIHANMPRRYNVGADVLNFCPHTLDELVVLYEENSHEKRNNL